MKHDVGALPLRDVRRVGCEHLCSFGLDTHLYNAQPCPEACDAFMVAAICISSPQAATSASRCWAVLVRVMYFWRSSSRCAGATTSRSSDTWSCLSTPGSPASAVVAVAGVVAFTY